MAAVTGRDALRVAVVAGGLCVIGAVWAVILASLSAQRAEALHGAAQNAENLARAFEEDIVRTFLSLDQSLRSLRRGYAKLGRGFDIKEWTSSTRAMADMATQFAITDKRGLVVAGTLTKPGEHTDLSARPHFLALRGAADDRLYIGPPVTGLSSGKLVVVVGRKALSPDGAFNGIVLASLDLDYLRRFYRSVNLGRLGIVRLVSQDGVVIVRASEKPAEDRAASGQNDHTGQLLAQFSHAASGEFVAPSQTDGITRVFAYRGTSGLPLIVQVGIAQSETLRRFTKNARNLYFLGGVVTILALMVMTMHLVRDSQLRKARDAAEARYALKLRLLATTVANISQGIVVIGADNQVELCNQRLSDMLDLPAGIPSPPEPLARMLHWLWTHDEFENAGGDFDTWLTTSLAALRARGARRSFEHTRPNGVILDIRTSLLPDGGIVRSFTDITDRKLEMQLLHAAQAGAARATEAKSAFLAIMSHEIRSPLSGLLGVLDLLRATPLDPEQSRMAGMIHGCGKMLLAVLNDILDFSKIEAGRLSVTAEPVDLHALLNEAVQPHILPGSDKGIDVSLSIDPSVPRMVMTDGLRVAQILGNLLSNAMKFTAGGRVAVRADIMAEAAGAPRLRVRVRDTGIGMDAGTISRLFKPFTQADGSITRTFGGTGLGLCISQQLACLLGGAISVSSRPNEGSHFSLSLPCVACAPPEVAQETNDDTQACPDVGGGLRVLLVDDDPTNRWLGQSQLRRLGFATDIAEDGEAALASLRATRYDLLVTDLHMPRMSGVDLAQAVRGDPDLAWRDVPIIGLTADTTDEQRLRCQQAGMTELTIKPITAVKLAALISRVLHRPGAPDTPPQAAQEAENATGGLLLTPFDPRIYLEIFPTHDQDGAEWLRGYLQHAQQDVDQLGAILEDGLALTEPACTPLRTELARIAHRLAGASFSVGATLMGQTARALEHAAQRDPAQGLRALHRTLRGQLASATRAIDIFQSAEHVADVTGGVQA